MKEDGNECPLYPSLLSKPYFFNHSTQAICFSLHHDPHRGHSRGVASHAPGSPELCSDPRHLSETLEQRTGTFLDLLAMPWLRQPRVCLAFPSATARGWLSSACGHWELQELLCRAAVQPLQGISSLCPWCTTRNLLLLNLSRFHCEHLFF